MALFDKRKNLQNYAKRERLDFESFRYFLGLSYQYTYFVKADDDIFLDINQLYKLSKNIGMKEFGHLEKMGGN